ncbi:hypothetical protein THRCLA_22491 [Thraustotheca clavata]|uniref:WD40 repeat-containing protein SMU1 n=1 Tax=Thraustotheca clavata TaxID=74557 RepID=A0A1V9YZK4_9STRA|nr:hypothetical protein THRCLA_22491 [Thraustotheca clavata]
MDDAGVKLVDKHVTSIAPEATFDENSPDIKDDILRLIVQYLQNEGYSSASATILDETNVKLMEKNQEREAIRKISKGIKEGDWDLVAKMIHKNTSFRKIKIHSQQGLGFLYAVCKQEYLELIDRQEYQKAFTYLTTHLKPMEKISGKAEFKDLCYLLTCKSINEVDSFRDWEGVVKSREKLAEQLKATFEMEAVPRDPYTNIPEDRLVNLLRQSVAYQMEFSRYHPKTIPKVTTLLRDFECQVLPNAVKTTFEGHTQNIKCVTFVGREGAFIASGSSDNIVKLWSTEPTSTEDPTINKISWDLHGHSSRIWYLCGNNTGDQLYSASGDGTVKIWNIKQATQNLINEVEQSGALSSHSDCVSTLTGHVGDVYTVNIHPSETHLVTGGYDQSVRLFDIQTGAMVKSFTGHSASVCDAQFNRHANLIVSGSKDGTVRFWDILSGLCVHTLRQTLGEVTSVSLSSNGLYLLTGSRNNSNRLWDMRMLTMPRTTLTKDTPVHRPSASSLTPTLTSSTEQRPLQRFKGHQNTAKNVVRAAFGPREDFVLGGSEDGAVYVWDVATGKLLERLLGHTGVTYSARWHERQALMASCSHDGTVKTWWWQDPALKP